MREISRAINATWDLDAALELITCKMTEAMDMNSSSIYLRDFDKIHLLW